MMKHKLLLLLPVLFACGTAPAPAPSAPPAPVTRAATASVLVAYHSLTGHTERMAQAVADGARSVHDVAVTIKRIDDVTRDDLSNTDALLLGSPTHWANLSSPVKAFIETWPDMIGRVGGAFATGGGVTGGKEHVVQSIVLAMLSHGMVVAGPVYEENGFRWGTPGASAATAGAGGGVEANELADARALGKRVAEVAAQMKRGAR